MQEISIVLIGHKDHGKSTLIGRLLLDTKSVKETKIKEIQEVDRLSGQKFELAHLVDSFKEEREREMTMDTTIALLKGKGEERIYQLIDVPGHGELISHMLTGASTAEAAILLVSIEEGIKEQTFQHLEIAKLLGIEQLAVVINKIDKVAYQKKPFEELTERLKKILEQIGYFSDNIKFFPISAWQGDNVVFKSSKTSWYQGSTLMDFIENNIKFNDFENAPLRFLVQDKYSENGKDVFVGRVESGEIKNGQETLFLPEKIKEKIILIKDSGDQLDKALSGENIGIILRGETKIKRGTVACLADSLPNVNNILKGEMFWIKSPSQKRLTCECGTAQAEGELLEPNIIKPGEKSKYKISLKKEIVFDPLSKTILGKIVLKDKGKIIGVGNIS